MVVWKGGGGGETYESKKMGKYYSAGVHEDLKKKLFFSVAKKYLRKEKSRRLTPPSNMRKGNT